MTEDDFDRDLDTIVFPDQAAYEAALKDAEDRKDLSAEIDARELWMSQHDLCAMRVQHAQTGDPRLVLEAVFDASQSGLPIAPWAAAAFVEAYSKVRDLEAQSWDDVFGPLWPKNFHVKAARTKRELRFEVYKQVERARKDGRPLSPDLFDELAESEIGGQKISGRTASKYYYSVRKMLDWLSEGVTRRAD